MLVDYEYYVYYDNKYPTSWVSAEVAKKIVEFLKKYDFEVVNASKLLKLMEKTYSKKEESKNVVIVFSQDVVPDTILDTPINPTANSPIRRFLNTGHSIVWIGDEPMLHVGFSDGRKEQLNPNFQQSVLGLGPATNAKRIAKPTYLGILMGLEPWIGEKPMSRSPSQPPYIHSLAQNPTDANNFHGFVATYVGSFFKMSGFIRIYDFELKEPEKVSNTLLKGILSVSLGGIHNLLEKDLNNLQNSVKRLEAKLNSFKSEIDAINPKLDEILEILRANEKSVSQNEKNEDKAEE